jgi:hypothetical protein
VSDSRSFAWRHRSAYSQFGTVAVALELVPLFNLLFMWTNVVGAALYVGDKYEKNEREIAKRNRSTSSDVYVYTDHVDTMNHQNDGYGSLSSSFA